jgi:hypothetical protein
MSLGFNDKALKSMEPEDALEKISTICADITYKDVCDVLKEKLDKMSDKDALHLSLVHEVTMLNGMVMEMIETKYV